jgi:hypothetical protein
LARDIEDAGVRALVGAPASSLTELVGRAAG